MHKLRQLLASERPGTLAAVRRLRRHSRVGAYLLLYGALGALSCSEVTAVVGWYHTPASDSDANPSASDSGVLDAGRMSLAASDAAAQDEIRDETIQVAAGSREEFCAAHGPALNSYVVKQGGGIERSCTAGVGRTLFPYALCSCGDITMGGNIATIDSFDSRQGVYAMGDGAGAVGANGSLTSLASLASHFGTTIVAGSGFFATGPMGFSGDVKSNAAIELGGIGISFERDLWVNADIRGMPTATLTRDLYQTRGYAGADTLNRVSGTKTVLLESNFAVTPPCPCTDSALLDIAGIVASAQTHNDNADVAISAADLGTRLSSGSVPTGFGCGRFVLSSVNIASDFSSAISGRVALFVDGNLTLGGDFGASLAPGAELDVFVTGDLRLSAPGQIGTQERPAALRLYIAGSASLTNDGSSLWAAQLYAPRAPVVIAGTVLGSIFAASIETQLVFVMHYDRSIMDAGEECTGAAPTPTKLLSADECHACPAGLAEVSRGVCGTCLRDADCCEPLVCESALCQPPFLTQK